ncbi:MAG TPA: hypothetical protein VH395_03595 [Jatrophihabitantaceae bacterium]
MTDRRPRLGERPITPRQRRLILGAGLTIMVVLVGAGVVLGYVAGPAGPTRWITTVLGAAAGVVVTATLSWIAAAILSVKIDKRPRPVGGVEGPR